MIQSSKVDFTGKLKMSSLVADQCWVPAKSEFLASESVHKLDQCRSEVADREERWWEEWDDEPGRKTGGETES